MPINLTFTEYGRRQRRLRLFSSPTASKKDFAPI